QCPAPPHGGASGAAGGRERDRGLGRAGHLRAPSGSMGQRPRAMHLTRATTAHLLMWLMTSRWIRWTPVTHPLTSSPSTSQEQTARFRQAGLAAQVTATGQAETGQVDLTELRDSVADPQVLTEEQLAELQRSPQPEPPSEEPTPELQPETAGDAEMEEG